MFLSKTSKYLDVGCWCSKTIYKCVCLFSPIYTSFTRGTSIHLSKRKELSLRRATVAYPIKMQIAGRVKKHKDFVQTLNGSQFMGQITPLIYVTSHSHSQVHKREGRSLL